MTDMPVWERRFRAPTITLPHWSRHAPDRTVFESNESGIWQVHAWDLATGERRQVSTHPVGVTAGFASLDGSEVLFWQEDTGDETGRWLAQAWEGGGDEPFLEGVPVGWSEGMAQAPGVVAVAISDRDGFGLYVSRDGAPATRIASSSESIVLGGGDEGRVDIAALSADGSLLVVEHAEHGDQLHPALRVFDTRTGAVVADQRDEGLALSAMAWSPSAGDQRLAVVHERTDRERPALWDLGDGSWTDLAIDLPGDVRAIDWWPDASALLLRHAFEGRHELIRYDTATGAMVRIPTPPGVVDDARVRPDGTVWFLHSDGERRQRVLDDAGNEVVRPEGPEAPPGRPFESWHFTNRHGQTVHGFLIAPEGEGPFPVLMDVHGGPTWLYEDRYMPDVQAYVDLGFLVAIVNYRGSTGYGRTWRDALNENVGFADVDDVTDGLEDLVARGVVDPDRAVVAGWSWGGYITLMQVGREPERWRAAMAGVPVGDYVRAYEEEAPSLQAMDRALMGGTPDEVPERFERGSPVTYVEHVAAPVLFVIGENDSRCPLGQALAYVDRMKELGKPHETYLFSTGHGSHETDEEVRQQRVILGFLKTNVPGLTDI
jgi:dipeptidyl aminopeptidase/acylaminoacyl peptidase